MVLTSIITFPSLFHSGNFDVGENFSFFSSCSFYFIFSFRRDDTKRSSQKRNHKLILTLENTLLSWIFFQLNVSIKLVSRGKTSSNSIYEVWKWNKTWGMFVLVRSTKTFGPRKMFVVIKSHLEAEHRSSILWKIHL